MRTVTDYTFGVIPMFLLMGTLVSNSRHEPRTVSRRQRFSSDICAADWDATVAACGRLCGLCGSSVATAATFRPWLSEMRRFGYPQSFATGVIAAGRHAGGDAAAVDRARVYGIITEQGIGTSCSSRLHFPGILAITM